MATVEQAQEALRVTAAALREQANTCDRLLDLLPDMSDEVRKVVMDMILRQVSA